MKRTRTFAILFTLLTLLLCLSAMTVAVASAAGDPPAQPVTLEVATSTAQDGKVTLSDVAPGLYLVSIKGKDPAGVMDFGFYIEETQETYVARCPVSFDETKDFVPAFAAMLGEGTNTLVLHVNEKAEGLEITDYKFTLIEAFPKAADGVSVHYSMAANSAQSTYVMLQCPKGGSGCDAKCTGVHYRATLPEKDGRDVFRYWDPSGTCFYTIADLPANCVIANVSGDESAGESNSANMHGFDYCFGPAGTRGCLFLRSGSTIKMTFTAPKAGKYKLIAVARSSAGMAATPGFTVNGTPKEVSGNAVWTDASSLFVSNSQTSAEYYGSFGTLTLAAGENTVLLDVNETWLAISGIEFVHEHEFTMQSDATQHWGTCACGESLQKTSHTTPADDGDCSTAIICPDCQYALTPAKSHTGGTATCTVKAKCTNAGCDKYYGDLMPHTGGTATCTERAKCAVCQAEYGAFLKHTGGTATCTQKAKCDVCKQEYGTTEPHSYTLTDKDATHHWEKCANCDAGRNKKAHTGGTATCTVKAKCEACEAEYGELAAHTYEQKSDEAKHWNECTVCANKDGETAHTYGEDKKCVCGAEKTGCGASIAASAVAVTAILALGIGFVRKKKED